MAEFLVRNSLNPSKSVVFGITYRQLVSKGSSGALSWVIEIKTNELDVNGNVIPSVYINTVSLNNIDEEINKAVAELSTKINWLPLSDDTCAPYVDSISPSQYEIDLESSVEVVLKEILPAAGIDVNTIAMTVNGFDVTSELEITGDPYEYKVKWSPFIRVMSEY